MTRKKAKSIILHARKGQEFISRKTDFMTCKCEHPDESFDGTYCERCELDLSDVEGYSPDGEYLANISIFTA